MPISIEAIGFQNYCCTLNRQLECFEQERFEWTIHKVVDLLIRLFQSSQLTVPSLTVQGKMLGALVAVMEPSYFETACRKG